MPCSTFLPQNSSKSADFCSVDWQIGIAYRKECFSIVNWILKFIQNKETFANPQKSWNITLFLDVIKDVQDAV